MVRRNDTKYQKRKAEDYAVPDEDNEAWLCSLRAVVPMESSDNDLSDMSDVPGKGVIPSTLQVSDKSIQFPVLPLVCTSMSHAVLRGELHLH